MNKSVSMDAASATISICPAVHMGHADSHSMGHSIDSDTMRENAFLAYWLGVALIWQMYTCSYFR